MSLTTKKYERSICTIHRCKCCEKARKADGLKGKAARVVQRVDWTLSYNVLEGFSEPTLRHVYQQSRHLWTGPDGVQHRQQHTPSVPCRECDRPTFGERIDGTKNDDVACDARCTGAVGHSCECSCGGANHGADHG